MLRSAFASLCRRLTKTHALVTVGLAVVAGFTSMAVARDDAGTHSFFQQEFTQREGQAPLRPTFQDEAHSLTIRPARQRQAFRKRHDEGSRRRVAVASRSLSAGAHVAVSVYEDPTLRRGDVVMFDDGLRVFAGSNQFPYGAGDFATLAETHDVSRRFLKELTVLASGQPGRRGWVQASNLRPKLDTLSVLR